MCFPGGYQLSRFSQSKLNTWTFFSDFVGGEGHQSLPFYMHPSEILFLRRVFY